MQTTIDYVFEQLEENSLFFRGTDNEMNISISASDYLDLKRLAKEMEKQQIIKSRENGISEGYRRTNNFYYDKLVDSEQYFTKTYGSKGSDETKNDNI